MISIKICNELKNLSRGEEKEFLKFAASRIAVKRNLLSFAKAIIKLTKQEDEVQTSREYLNLITKKLKLKRTVATSRLSELSRVYEYFMLVSYSRTEVLKRYFFLLEIALSKNDFRLFDEIFIKLESTLYSSKLNFSYCEKMYKLYESGSYRYFIENKPHIYGLMLRKKADYKKADFIFDYFITEIEKIQKTLIYKSSEDPYLHFTDKIAFVDVFKSIKETDQRLYSLLSELYTCYLTFLNPDKKNFYKELRTLQDKFKNYYDVYVNDYFFRIMINHCINRINSGDSSFIKELFALQSIVSENLKHTNEFNLIIKQHLRDFVYAALELKKYNWTNRFIQKIELINDGNCSKEDIYLVKALYFIYKKKFDSALNLLNKVKIKNYEYYIPSRLYKIRSFYYMNDYERAIDELIRVRKYVSYHDEIPYSIRIKYNNDLKDLKMLIDYMTGTKNLNSIKYYFTKRTLPRVNNWILREVKSI